MSVTYLVYSFSSALGSERSRGKIILQQPNSRKERYILKCYASGRPILQLLLDEKTTKYKNEWIVELSHSKAKTILQLCKNISFSVNAKGLRLTGRDGFDFSLRFYSGMNSVELVWWCDLPEEWQSLAPLVHILNKLVAEHIPSGEWILKPND